MTAMSGCLIHWPTHSKPISNTRLGRGAKCRAHGLVVLEEHTCYHSPMPYKDPVVRLLKNREYGRAWRARNPTYRAPSYYTIWSRPSKEASQAHGKVRTALRNGTLVKPDQCECCGRDGRFIEAAHDDYGEPLVVRWMCRPCHRYEDSQKPKGGVRPLRNGERWRRT